MLSRSSATIVCSDWCSDGFTLSISNGEVYAVGNQDNGGHGHSKPLVIPLAIPSLKQIVSISCSYSTAACIDINGSLFTFGNNEYGQLGVGKDKDNLITYIPQIVNLPPVRQVSSGQYFIVALCDNGNLYSFGINTSGQLGHGNNTNYYYPKKIDGLENIDFVECGSDFTVCKAVNNNVFVWGGNDSGQLGIGNTTNINIPLLCTDWPDNIVDIKCGHCNLLVLTDKQEVYSCGKNNFGQLGFVESINTLHCLTKIENLSDIVRIECGYFHALCIDIDSNLFVFGANDYGQLGLNDLKNRYQPIKHPTLSNIIDISKGGCHTFVKTSNNEIYAFGLNELSQLGIDSTENEVVPIRVFEDNEDIWFSNINKSKAKSARF